MNPLVTARVRGHEVLVLFTSDPLAGICVYDAGVVQVVQFEGALRAPLGTDDAPDRASTSRFFLEPAIASTEPGD